MELTVADVERHDVLGTALQQAVREPARRRAGIQGPATANVDHEVVERGLELEPAAADVLRWRSLHDDGVAGIDLAGRLVGSRAVDEHAAERDLAGRLRAAGSQPAADELGVEPATSSQRRLSERWS
jgi:hypothetical protein